MIERSAASTSSCIEYTSPTTEIIWSICEHSTTRVKTTGVLRGERGAREPHAAALGRREALSSDAQWTHRSAVPLHAILRPHAGQQAAQQTQDRSHGATSTRHHPGGFLS